MQKRYLLSWSFVVTGLLVSNCHDRQPDPEPEPDPCLTAAANPLTIRFLEQAGTPTPDTAFTQQTITFEAPGAPYTSYEWQIGADKRRFTGQRVGLYFPNEIIGRVPVRLIARRSLNTKCFPKDDGVDTLQRTLTLVSREDQTIRPAPIYGKFQGSNRDNPSDTFTIRIFKGPDPYNVGSPIVYNFLRNLNKGCQSPYFDIGLVWNGLEFSYGAVDFGCITSSGKGYLTTRDSIRVDYEEFPFAASVVKRTFLGRRVH